MNPRKVGWTPFTWAIGLLGGMMLAGFVWTFNAVNAAEKRVAAAEGKVDALQQTLQSQLGPVTVSLAEIKTDVSWIKLNMERLAVTATTGRR